MSEEKPDPTQESATEAGVAEQSEEIQKRFETTVEEAPDISDPEQWRGANKEGGGA